MPSSDRPRRAAHFGTRAPETNAPETAARGDAPVSSPDARTGSGQSPVPDVPVITSADGTSPHPALGSARLSNRTTATTRRAASKAGTHQRRGGVRVNLPALLVGVAVVAAIGFVAFRFVLPLFSGSSSDKSQSIVAGQTVQVTIPEGSSASQVAQALYDAGVISNTDDFLTQVHRRDLESSLKSGTYTLVTGGDMDSLLSLLTSGPNSSSASLTIPEGYTVTKIAASVETTFGISADDFIAQAKASNYVADYPFLSAAANDSLEGFLFPKTYDFSGQTVTADLIIRAMLSQYQTKMASYDFATSEAAIQSTYGRERTLDCAHLACGFHLVPNTELAAVLADAGVGLAGFDRQQRDIWRFTRVVHQLGWAHRRSASTRRQHAVPLVGEEDGVDQFRLATRKLGDERHVKAVVP